MMNITKQKQTHRHRKKTCGYQLGEGRGRDNYRKGRLGTNYHI